MGMLGLGFEWAPGAVQLVEPAAGGAVPERTLEILEPMQRGPAEPGITGECAGGFGSKEGLAGLEFEELLMRPGGFPGPIEVAEEAAMLGIERAGEPRVQHVPPQNRFDLSRRRNAGVILEHEDKMSRKTG